MLACAGIGGAVRDILYFAAEGERRGEMIQKLANFAKTLTETEQETIGFIIGLLIGTSIGMMVVLYWH